MSLFDNAPQRSQQRLLSVAIPRPLDGLFTYRISSEIEEKIELGSWVTVPFGRGTTHAFVVEPSREMTELPPGLSLEQIKEIIEAGSSEERVAKDILGLCRWAHEYYASPLGEVLNCAVPAHLLQKKVSKKKKSLKKASFSIPLDIDLNEDQASAFQFLENLLRQEKSSVALLQGVTGSGKTEVYIELAKKTLQSGKGVIILVPEIALTPQLYQRFEKRLGHEIALWHSAVSPGKRKEQFRALKKGEINIVIGARSAVFAPVQNLGLIVVDEEHDQTYKQEDRVRYHARDLAIVRGKLTQSLVVLGSATPSLETLERVKEGRYLVTSLPKRIAPGGLPAIELVDLRVEPQVEDIQAPLALKTIQAIQEVIDAGEQVIVYLNRRGFANFLICRECSEVRGCPHCSITLTVHKRRSRLQCHVCGFYESIPDFCSKCKGTELYPVGAGTESMEVELSQLLSGAKILRLDRDQITSASRLEKCIDEFRNKQANILLGTQMLVKGHDFPGVTLVVVVLADSLLRWPDFRAPERAYQVLRQVAGRSGRGEKLGKVFIQTFDPSHPVLQAIDGRISEKSFLEGERDLRQVLGYPPFGRLARIRFDGDTREEVQLHSNQTAMHLRQWMQKEIAEARFDLLGPSEAFLEKVNRVYRWDLLLKAKQIESLQKALYEAKKFCSNRKWSIGIDVDPYF